MGNTTISGVSFFADGNIEGVKFGTASFQVDRDTQAIYRDWNTTLFTPPSEFNTVSRTNSAGTPLVGAGFAAEGLVCGSPCSGSVADGHNDYDSTTGTNGNNLTFDLKAPANAPNPSGVISYPFDPVSDLDTGLPLDVWEEDARAQGTYKTPAQIGNKIDNATWPTPQSQRNVYFVEAGGQTIDIDYRVNLDPVVAEGVIVVRNGNLSISNASNGFRGIIVVTGNGTSTGNYTSTGNDTVTGFVVAEGTMQIGGTVEPSVAVGDFESTPGYQKANLWSWRECYSVNCS